MAAHSPVPPGRRITYKQAGNRPLPCLPQTRKYGLSQNHLRACGLSRGCFGEDSKHSSSTGEIGHSDAATFWPKFRAQSLLENLS